MKYLKSYIPAAALILLVVVAFVGLKSSMANAAGCPGGANLGAGFGYGYFTCTNPALSNDDDVFPGLLSPADTDATTFENIITGQLNNNGNSAGNSDLSTGAAFIIDTMMGVQAGSCDRTVCDTSVADWKTLVSEYGNLGLIKYDPSFSWTCGITDTLYDPGANDDFYFALEPGGSAVPCGSSQVVSTIEFLSPTTKAPIFSIKIDCGNPVGSLQPLPTPKYDTISGTVQTKNTTTNVVSNVGGVTITLTDNTLATSSTTTSAANGTYSIKVPDGHEFSIGASLTLPTGDTGGPYTDYLGAASFTGVADAYKCGTEKYQDQLAGNTPSEFPTAGCVTSQTITSNSNFDFVYTGTSSGGCTTNCSSGAPTFTCNTGSYDVTPVVNPDTAYIGADYPASITFNTSGNFDSDSNHNINLTPYPNQTSQLTVESTGTDDGLGITAPVTYNLSPGNDTVGPLSLQTPVGIYSVPYQVKIVNVVIDPDPAAHWAPIPNPNPTKETPAAPPASSYTNETTTIAAPVYTTVEAAGDPTTGYYTKEDITTTYTYTKTTTTAGATTYTCPSGWSPPSGSAICSRTEANGKVTTIPATPHTGSPTTTTTTVAVDTSDQYYYYITWVSTPNVECPPPVNVQVGYQPYMKVYGGDVVAGSTFDPGLTTACTPLSQDSNIVGWNYDTSPNYSGGGTEYAGYALGAIDGFATSQGSGTAGTGLSFASVGVSSPASNSPSNGEFGGSFVPVSCAPDFFDAKPANAPAPGTNLSNLASGSYYQNGPLTINGGTISTGNHVTIYVNGNVDIDNNITLGGTWNTIGDIPSFELIVQNGNIYIDGSVTRLDGVYVAQDLNQNGTGTIYDCSVANSSGTEVLPTGNQFSTSCYNSLTVNGSFIATQVDLMRTTSPENSTSSRNTLFDSSGDSSTSTNASEVFNYSPAVWLGLTNNALLGTNSNNTILNNYNSITSLPPVL